MNLVRDALRRAIPGVTEEHLDDVERAVRRAFSAELTSGLLIEVGDLDA